MRADVNRMLEKYEPSVHKIMTTKIAVRPEAMALCEMEIVEHLQQKHVMCDVDNYYGSLRGSLKCDIVVDWKSRSELYPNLSNLAMNLLCVNSSTVAYKSAFQSAEKQLRIRPHKWD